MTWRIDPSYTWHRCDAHGPLCPTEDKLVGDVAELPGGACIACTKCLNKLAISNGSNAKLVSMMRPVYDHAMTIVDEYEHDEAKRVGKWLDWLWVYATGGTP